MPIMRWDTTLDVGVETMNHEHRGLLDLMNRLYDAEDKNLPGTEKIAILEALQSATIAHFAHEESFFDGIGFPDAKSHKLIHKSLLTRLSKGVGDIKANGGNVPDAFFEFLKYWLTAHIRDIDVKYGDFANGNKKARLVAV